MSFALQWNTANFGVTEGDDTDWLTNLNEGGE